MVVAGWRLALKYAASRPPASVFYPETANNPAGLPGAVAVFSGRMFDLVKPQIATAADKLTHLRRFL
jgi:hypothetical protein